MKIQLKTLTPLHIGNGEELHSLDYVVHQRSFYRISQRQFENFMETSGVKGIENAFSDWVIETADEIENLKEEASRTRDKRDKMDFNQKQSQLKKQFNYLSFAQKQKIDQPFIAFLKKNLVEIPITAPDLATRKQAVRGLMTTATGLPYLPGSSLKGAIRTALMFDVLENKKDKIQIEALLQKALDATENDIHREGVTKGDRAADRKREQLKKNFGEALEHAVFYCGNITEKGFAKQDDEKYDLMKLIIIADAHTTKQARSLESIDGYLISKTKDRNDKLIKQAEIQRQTPCIEAITEGVTFKDVSIEFNIDFLLTLKNTFTTNPKFKKENWLGIEQKVKHLFDIDFDGLTSENLAEQKQRTLTHIRQCVQQFSQRQLDFDQHWLDNFEAFDTRREYSPKLKQGFATVLNPKGRTFINVGYAAGFGSTTVLFYLLDKHRPELKRVMSLFGIGNKPNNKGLYTPAPDNFPKSKRLVSRTNSIQPVGWLEWIDGNAPQNTATSEAETVVEVVKKEFVPTPLRGAIKPGNDVFAQIVSCGKPNKVRLFIAEDKQPIVDCPYGMGFDAAKKDAWIVVKITSMRGKTDVGNVSFVKFVD